MFEPLLPLQFLHRAARLFPGKTAVIDGQHRYTYRQLEERVRRLSNALRQRGIGKGDKVAVLSPNTHRMLEAFFAVPQIGAVLTPLNYRLTTPDFAYILDHAEAKALLIDWEFAHQIAPLTERLTRLRHYLLLRDDETPSAALPAVDYEDALADASAACPEPPVIDETDLATLNYTSGTTARPKGVMLSYDNIAITSRNALQREGLGEREEILSYLPMAWVGDHIFSYGQFYCGGFTLNCPESSDTVLMDLHDIGPTYFFAPPRMWENILTSVMIRLEDAAWIKRKVCHFFLQVAQRVGARKLANADVSLFDAFLYRLGHVLVYGPPKDNLGFSRIRLAYTAGEAIGSEIFTFYRSLGINIKQLYGMTEASVFVCVQPDGDVKPDTVGTVMPEVEIKIAADGEVMYRSPGVFLGYYKNPDATAEALEDGWVHSGDAGYLDDAGHLKIIDRARDVSHLADGKETLFAPRYLENKLKFSPYVKEAVVFGQERPYVSAFINIDLEAVGTWAERRGLVYTSYADLAARPEVYDLVQGEIERVNGSLAEEPQMAGAQMRRFLVLHKELDPDDGELTRTRKVRRRVIVDKYGDLIEALYSDNDAVSIEAQVVFEDGRTGMIKADLRLRDVTPRPLETAAGSPLTSAGKAD